MLSIAWAIYTLLKTSKSDIRIFYLLLLQKAAQK